MFSPIRQIQKKKKIEGTQPTYRPAARRLKTPRYPLGTTLQHHNHHQPCRTPAEKEPYGDGRRRYKKRRDRRQELRVWLTMDRSFQERSLPAHRCAVGPLAPFVSSEFSWNAVFSSMLSLSLLSANIPHIHV